jgi:hypothetical protein
MFGKVSCNRCYKSRLNIMYKTSRSLSQLTSNKQTSLHKLYIISNSLLKTITFPISIQNPLTQRAQQNSLIKTRQHK